MVTPCCNPQVKSLEVGTNVVAAYVSGGRAHEVPAVMDALALKASDGFEIAFNQACADVAVGKLDIAERQLLLAQRLGEHTHHSHSATDRDMSLYCIYDQPTSVLYHTQQHCQQWWTGVKSGGQGSTVVDRRRSVPPGCIM